MIPGIKHKIIALDPTPVVKRSFQIPFKLHDQVEKKLHRMLESGIIWPNESLYSSPTFSVLKKNGDLHLVVDYREFNRQTVKTNIPIPRVNDLIYTLEDSCLFSKLDLVNGYQQIAIEETDIPVTAFVLPRGNFEFTRMPFGLTNAPIIFQRVLSSIFVDLKKVKIYLDNILLAKKKRKQNIWKY